MEEMSFGDDTESMTLSISNKKGTDNTGQNISKQEAVLWATGRQMSLDNWVQEVLACV